MDGLTFLRNDILRIPKTRDKEDFVGYVHSLFDNFVALIDEVEGTDALSELIVGLRDDAKMLCNSVLAANQAYFKGYPHEAYNEIDQALAKHSDALGSFEHPSMGGSALESLYRIRIGDGTGFSRSDLFHIPFEHREFVRSQRFSIPGYPCLYMGGSVYVCWEELGRPDLNSVHVSQFSVRDQVTFQVLNLGYRPQFFSIILSPKIAATPEEIRLPLHSSRGTFVAVDGYVPYQG